MFATLGIRKRIQTQESSAGESGEDIVEQVWSGNVWVTWENTRTGEQILQGEGRIGQGWGETCRGWWREADYCWRTKKGREQNQKCQVRGNQNEESSYYFTKSLETIQGVAAAEQEKEERKEKINSIYLM